MDPTPMHGRYAMDHPTPSTPAQVRGTALHCAVFEPVRWESEFAELPKLDRRTKEGRELHRELREANPGKELLPADDYESVKGMAESIRATKAARRLIESAGSCECSAVWTDEKTGLQCKGRFDKLAAIAGRTVIIELKTTVDASPFGFPKQSIKYGYHVQTSYYLTGHERATGQPAVHVTIAVESDAPYAVALYTPDDSTLLTGSIIWRRYLDMYAECVKTGRWPGYADRIETLSLPSWAHRTESETND
jgi:hypothetical protein